MILRAAIFLLYVCIVPYVTGSYYSTVNYTDDAGILYESIGEAGISLHDFDLVISYNLKEYLSKYVNIQRYVERLTLFCKTHRLTMSGDCENFLYAFNHEMNYLERKHELINNIVGTFTAYVRRKRFFGVLFNIGASIVSGLMGMAADAIKKKKLEEAREEYRKKLREIRNMMQKLVETYESAQKKFTSKLLNVSWEIDALFVRADKYTVDLGTQGYEAKLLTLARYLNSLIHLLSVEQSNLLNFLIVARQGMMHPAIMTPSMLELRLLEAAERVKYNPNLVQALQLAATCADELFSTLKPTFYVRNQALEFVLKIPLIKESLFDIYKLTSVPVLTSDGVYGFIYPENPYLFVDKRNQRHFFLDTFEFDNCQSKSRRQYICKGIKPLRVKDFTCEHMLIFSDNLESEKCDIRFTKINRTLFIELESDGSWIYVTPEPQTINLQCNQEEIEITIVGTGIFSVDTNCMRAETGEIVLRDYAASDVQISEKYQIYRPDANLTEHLKDVNTSLCNASVNDMLLGRSETAKMKQSDSYLPIVRAMNVTEPPKEEEQPIDTGLEHTIVLYVLCLLCMVLLGGVVYLYIYLRKFSALISKTRHNVN